MKITLEKKLKELRKLLNKITELESEVRKEFPPKEILLVWEYKYGGEVRFNKYFTLKEAEQQKQFIIGPSNPRDYEFYICSIIS